MGSIWANRSTTAFVPNSGAHDDQTAPSDAVASRPITASGTLGRNAATRSPRLTPSRCRPARQRATASRSSSAVRSTGSRDCDRPITTTSDGSLPGHRERVFGVVDRGTREPARARHPGLCQRGSRRRRGPDAEVVPDRLPEGAGIVDRPAPCGVVAVEREPPLGRQPVEIATHPRALAGVAGRAPEDLGDRIGQTLHGSIVGHSGVASGEPPVADKLRGGSVRSRLVAVPVKVSTLRRTFCHASGSSIASA